MRASIVLCVAPFACGQMYQKPGSQPEPAPEPVAKGPPGGGADPWQDPGSPPSTMREAPAPARAEPRPTSGLSKDAQTIVDVHNRYRKQHCAHPLTWSPQLAKVAQQWADSLRDKGCVFGHSGGKFGENLAAGTSGALPPESVVTMWYDEVKLYSFAKPTFSMETGHFTQVVWRSTSQVGCGMAQCKGMDIWVCEYDPPGNWEGKYREQVLPVGCK